MNSPTTITSRRVAIVDLGGITEFTGVGPFYQEDSTGGPPPVSAKLGRRVPAPLTSVANFRPVC